MNYPNLKLKKKNKLRTLSTVVINIICFGGLTVSVFGAEELSVYDNNDTLVGSFSSLDGIYRLKNYEVESLPADFSKTKNSEGQLVLDFNGYTFSLYSGFVADQKNIIDLAGANFSGVKVNGTVFEGMASIYGNFTYEMLQSTQSYQDNDLSNITWRGTSNIYNDFTGWSFANMVLDKSVFLEVRNLNSVSFDGASINGVTFEARYGYSDALITKEQIYTTSSYKNGILNNVTFEGTYGYYGNSSIDLVGIQFGGRGDGIKTDIGGTTFNQVNLRDASFANLNLARVRFLQGYLLNTNFTDAGINQTIFHSGDPTVAANLSFSQLMSTDSYKKGDLRNVVCIGSDFLSNANFSGQHLDGAYFNDGSTAQQFGQYLSADLRGATIIQNNVAFTKAIAMNQAPGSGYGGNIQIYNTVFADGTMLSWVKEGRFVIGEFKKGLFLANNYYTGSTLHENVDFIAYDYSGGLGLVYNEASSVLQAGFVEANKNAISLKIEDNFIIEQNCNLVFYIEGDDTWATPMEFLTDANATTLRLDGIIKFTLAEGLSKAFFEGKTLQFIDWSGLFAGSFSESDIWSLFGFTDEDSFFAHVDFSALTNLGLDFDRSLFLSDGSLSFVPEPSSYALFIGFMAMLVTVSRRRRR